MTDYGSVSFDPISTFKLIMGILTIVASYAETTTGKHADYNYATFLSVGLSHET